MEWREPTTADIAKAFAHRTDPTVSGPLICLYLARIAKIAAELDVVVAVHSSAPWTNWQDFRIWEPTAFIPFLQTFRDTRFDLYHAGIPYGTPASLLARAFPNVWLNLAWSHIVSPELSMRSMAEWLDMVPLNKISAFGGDYHNGTVPFTYGHLTLARENVVRVLGYRIRSGQLGLDEACGVLQQWFYDNPKQLYRLPCPPVPRVREGA